MSADTFNFFIPEPGEPGSAETPFPPPPLPPDWTEDSPDAIDPEWSPGDPVPEVEPT